MKKIIFLTILTSVLFSQTQRISIKSTILNQTRFINVHLPEDYQNSSERYAVIYMLDGDNDNILTANAARLHYKNKDMPAVIVVGISNIDRRYDFQQNASKFLAFIKSELIPEINQKYRTTEHKVFKGHSLGGLFTSYVISQDINLFNGYFIYSPAMYRAKSNLYADIEMQLKTKNFPDFIYMSVGSAEGQRFQTAYTNLKTFLQNKLPKSITFYTEINQGIDHMENPEVSIPNALKLVWKKKN